MNDLPMDPLDWTAGPFLALYACLALATLSLLYVWRGRLGGRRRDASADGLDPVSLAYLAGGPMRAADTVLVGLFEANAVTQDEKGKNYVADGRNIPGNLRAYCGDISGKLNRWRFHKTLYEMQTRIRDDLVQRGLAPAQSEVSAFRLLGFLLLAAVLGFGFLRAYIGSQLGHPIGFLCAMMVATAIIGLMPLLWSGNISPAGREALARTRRERARALRAPLPEELLFAFAIGGTAVLAGRPYQPFFATSSSGSDGGGGGDSGGGDGGGGGCGGGGCGGCGG